MNKMILICKACGGKYDFYSFSVLLKTGQQYRSMDQCSKCAVDDPYVEKIIVSTKGREENGLS